MAHREILQLITRFLLIELLRDTNMMFSKLTFICGWAP